MDSRRLKKKLVWSWLLAGAFSLFLAFAFDPPTYVEQTFSGVVIANSDPGYIHTNWNSLTVRLVDGRIVTAETPADRDFPYKAGTPVSVVAYRTLIFRKHAYRAFNATNRLQL
jgi:hypothetical protein